MTGRFIVIGGLDATGKSTLAPKLAKKLNAALHVHRSWRHLDSRRGILRLDFDCRPPAQSRAYRPPIP